MQKTTFIILCLEAMVLSFNVQAASALVPSIASAFKVSPFLAGRIIWLYMLPYGISALFYGPIVRAIDARNIELVCLFLFSLANLLAGLSNSIYTLFVARFFMGVFGASVIPLSLILIARYIEEKKRGRAIGIFFSTTFIASLLGLFLSGIIAWRLIFLIPAIVGFILWIHVYFYLPSFQEDAGNLKINYLASFKRKAIISVFTYIFFVSLLYHGIQQWLAVYFSRVADLNQFTISMLITLTIFSGIFGEAVGGWFSDILGRSKVVNLGVALMVLAVMFLIYLKAGLFILAILMIIWGLGWTFTHVGLSTILTDLPQEFLNEAASLNSSVRFLSGGLGVALAGVLMQRSFNLSFLIFGTGLVLFGLFAKNLLIVK